MKKMMIMGGLLGFGIGVITGLMKEVSGPAIFLRACVCALLAGLLFRWWAQVWVAGLRDSAAQAAAAAAAAAKNNPAPAKATPLTR